MSLPASRRSLAFIEQFGSNLQETSAARRQCFELWKIGFRDNLWDEICTEFDARRLAEYVRHAHLPLSDEFRSFEACWLADENAHYLGFRRLYSTLYRVPEADLAARVERRPSSFPAAARFLGDEFRLALLLAYDEIATAKAYARDFAIYDGLGDPNVSAWIRLVCRDESYHCQQAVQILKRRYRARLDEVPHVLEALTVASVGSTEYEGSFVLDHQHYPPVLIESARRAVLRLCLTSQSDS